MMKFNYPKLVTDDINCMRFYKNIDGDIFPSITTILGYTQDKKKIESLQNWKNSIGNINVDKIVKDAAENGTAVHLLIEYYFKDKKIFYEKLKEFSDFQIKLFNTIKFKLDKVQEVWGLEVSLYSENNKIAGRCDCVGIYKNKPTIIDFKTSLRIKNAEMIEDYFLQITAYAIMHNELFNTNIEDGVIFMASGGMPQEFKIRVLNFKNKLEKRIEQFYDKLQLTILT